ncbi:UDP-Glycosyltransferase superfamily protein [Actinidia rufa]|uniref:UDP-Glycosyltransferase superfamily protein n=1 Tax=Actinidia rufa TaxID=165716 RepID=A0A7J0ECB0_9ERIC|nr:UDP-Glycosyltransferase superfamily protein [Actinidia rufa]
MATVTSSRFVSRNSWVATGSDPKLTFTENGMRNEFMTRSGLRPLNKLDLLQLRTHGKPRQLRRKASKPQTAARARQGVIKCESGMTVAFVAAEVSPWSKTGGLGDVLGGLPPAMAANGHRVMTISPRYDQYKDAWDTNVAVELKVGDSIETVRFFHCYKRGVDRVFVDHPIFLEKAALEAPRVLNLTSNEYFSGPYGVSRGIYKNAKVAFCIHNIAYQGRFAFSDFELLNLPEEFKGSFDFIDGYDKPVKGRKINWMKAGILESDRVLTVSPYYAQELASGEEKGVELDNIIRKTGITGIVNGMDAQEWNPSTDKYITVNYDASTVMEAKSLLKEDLQAEVGLPIDRNIPVIGFIGRLEEQKGSDILAAAIAQFIDEDVQIIILGTGKKPMEKQIEELAELYPDKARGVAKFNRPLAHKITAGVDFILIPSRFEPCGLIQLQAMPYGTIPIVVSTGGLFDTVKEGFTGFQMGAFNVECKTVDPADVKALATNVKRALKTYGTPALAEMVQNCMAQDLSWKGPAKKWENILLSLEVAGSEPGIEGEEIAPLAKENVATP